MPDAFLANMKELLGDEYGAFLASYAEKPERGLRVNTLKIAPEDYRELSPWPLTPVPWEAAGYVGAAEGRHPHHLAGLFYIQEPSAMAAAGTLDPKPHERVLDLSAAPGGKATALAARMENTGFFVANEIVPARARTLLSNVERMGIRNAVVVSEDPRRLLDHFGPYFDRVLVDAPCSGEGMFRREPEGIALWNGKTNEACAQRQSRILDTAAGLVRGGGRLLYSTCTFSPLENEEAAAGFLARHSDFVLEPIAPLPGFSEGLLPGTVRIWPHKAPGEGHFMARFRKKGEEASRLPELALDAAPKPLREFAEGFFTASEEGPVLPLKESCFVPPEGCPRLSGLRVLRCGLALGEVRGKHFVPHHAMAMALLKGDARRELALAADDPRLLAYLRGETVPGAPDRGWGVVLVDGYPVGLMRESEGIYKNGLPKGLRLY
nr:RsmF rRNA methyltransferase first C-terminal domain-containing protein [Gehongia tenuis]